MCRKYTRTLLAGGCLLLFFAFSGFREEQREETTLPFGNCSEYMVLSMLENEMSMLETGEDKYTDQGDTARGVMEFPSYMTKYAQLYAPETDKISESSDVQKQEGKKTAYLSFDDGPSENTSKVLDVLKAAQVHATFFLIGEEITPEREEIVRRIVEEGHVIGLHTYCHDYDTIYRSVDTFLEDYEKVYTRIREVTGKSPSIYRFPGGSTNRHAKKDTLHKIMKEMRRRGFCYYDWNVSAEDSVGKPTRYSIRTNIFKDVFRYDDPVLLMHDSNANRLTVEMLPDIIAQIKQAGYEFDTLENRESCQFEK